MLPCRILHIDAYAKINWCLAVTGRASDGYHLLDMLMQRVSLHDTLFAAPAQDVTLYVAGQAVEGNPEDNLVLRAAQALRHYAPDSGVRLTLVKRIPQGAGLGGGSSDAAAALRLLNCLWGLNLPQRTLEQTALHLGADVPFFLDGRPARVRGIGEQLTPAALPADVPLVIVKLSEGLNTAAVYRRSDMLPPTEVDVPALLERLSSRDLCAAKAFAGNALYPAAAELQPGLETAKRALETSGAHYVLMTGSGAAVYGAYNSDAQAIKAAEQLRQTFPGAFVAFAHTVR